MLIILTLDYVKDEKADWKDQFFLVFEKQKNIKKSDFYFSSYK